MDKILTKFLTGYSYVEDNLPFSRQVDEQMINLHHIYNHI